MSNLTVNCEYWQCLFALRPIFGLFPTLYHSGANSIGRIWYIRLKSGWKGEARVFLPLFLFLRLPQQQLDNFLGISSYHPLGDPGP